MSTATLIWLLLGGGVAAGVCGLHYDLEDKAVAGPLYLTGIALFLSMFAVVFA